MLQLARKGFALTVVQGEAGGADQCHRIVFEGKARPPQLAPDSRRLLAADRLSRRRGGSEAKGENS